MLELAVLAGDAEMANKVMDDVLATYSETWQPQTTAGNLRIIHSIRGHRGDDVSWITRIVEQLDAAAGVQPTPSPVRGPS